MSNLEYYDLVRLVNATLAVVVFSLAVAKARRLWPSMPFQARLMYMAFLGLVVAMAYSSIENLLQDNQPGFRVSFVGASLVVALIAFLWPDPGCRWMGFWKRR